MKRNAIIRIIIWSVVIVILLGILLSVLLGISLKRTDTVEATMAPAQLVEDTNSVSLTATVTKRTNVYASPSTDATRVAVLNPGVIAEISTQETVSGVLWSYIVQPSAGWIPNLDGEIVYHRAEGPGYEDEIATADANINVRSAPSSEASVVGMIEAGNSIVLGRQEQINGESWSYVLEPIQGWIATGYVSFPTEPVSETTWPIEDTIGQATAATEIPDNSHLLPGNAVSFEPADIQDIEIEWAAGSIVIQPKNVDKITIMEDTLSSNQAPMVWKTRNGKLSIAFCKDTDLSFIGISLGKEYQKNLTIQVPIDWVCNTLEIDAASATVEVYDLAIREVEFDGASGNCSFENCIVDSLDMDTASGDILFTGNLQTLDCDAASAKVTLDLKNTPRQLDLDTASGDLVLYLPSDAGFTVTIDSMSSDFKSDFETTSRNGSYLCGDGRCRINVDAMSGDVTIYKGTSRHS